MEDKQQIATTIDQYKRLRAAGVNPATADMCYIFFDKGGEQISLEEWLECAGEIDRGESYLIPKDFGMYDHSYSDECPAWSLSALLNLLPKRLEGFPLNVQYHPFAEGFEAEELDVYQAKEIDGDVKLYNNGINWIVDYDWDGFSGTLPQDKSPVEAVVLAIELLALNGYEYIKQSCTNEKEES